MLKRTVSLRQLFLVPTTYIVVEIKENYLGTCIIKKATMYHMYSKTNAAYGSSDDRGIWNRDWVPYRNLSFNGF